MRGLPCIRDTRGDGLGGPGPARCPTARSTKCSPATRTSDVRTSSPPSNGQPPPRRSESFRGRPDEIFRRCQPVARRRSRAPRRRSDAVHVIELGLVTADDDRILDAAAYDNSVIVTADADFGTLLAIRGLAEPSVVLLRSADHLGPPEQAALLLANFAAAHGGLEGSTTASISRSPV